MICLHRSICREWEENMHMVEIYLEQFINYLKVEKDASTYTVTFYTQDVEMFISFLNKEGIIQVNEVDQTTIRLFLTDLCERNLSRKSVSRTISCLRTFYKFLEKENVTDKNSFIHIHLPKQAKLIPSFYYVKELNENFSHNY